MNKQQTIILSFDALGSRDLGVLKTQPGFSRLMEKASWCDRVNSVYPSLTYPCHTSISTGKLPMNHGVVSNTLLQPGRESPDWNWTRDRIKADTFYDAALRKGLTVSALLWPVTGKSRITWNLPEIFPNRPWQNQILVSLQNGTPDYELALNRKFGHLRQGIAQPQLDDFVLASALWTLKEKKPDVLMVHFVELDAMRHHHGYDSKEAQEALLSYDRRLQAIFSFLDKEGRTQNTTLFVLGDHDQILVNHTMHLNSVLKAKGLLKTRGQKIIQYDAYVHSQDGSAYVYLANPRDEGLKSRVEKILTDLAQREDFGIERILSAQEAKARGANRHCTFMLEARRGYHFHDSHTQPALTSRREHSPENDAKGWSTHGFDPEKSDYQTVFFAWGKGIRSGVRIPSMSLIDEGPTFAHSLGTRLSDPDGRILMEIFED